jgi:hypothetical protein
MNRKAYLAATLLCLVLSSFVSAAHASVGISDVSPREGTVGTELTLSGSGFGEKRGEVLIGPEKCKVLAWSAEKITCKVVKPQTGGAYLVTVLLQGDKKPAEPLTFTAFTMRGPQIIPADTPSGLISDGETVTILGDFFGDKRGDVSVVDQSGATVTAKVVDWSMKSIRVEIPRTLIGATGDFVLKVKNEVGDAFRPVHIDNGMPGETVGFSYIGDAANRNASAVTYQGTCYLFTLHPHCLCLDDREIQVQKLSWDWDSAGPTLTPLTASIPGGRSDASVVPLVIEDEMWVFHTGTDGVIYFTRYDGTQWGTGWFSIPNVTARTDWEVAPVYDPISHRINVFYGSDGKLNRVYTDHYGAPGYWIRGGEVPGVGAISTAPSAVRYVSTWNNAYYDTLLAVGDSTNQGKVLALNGGVLVGTALSFGSVWARPFLEDAGPFHNEINLIWLAKANDMLGLGGTVCQKGLRKWDQTWWADDCYPAWAKAGFPPTSYWGPDLAIWYPPTEPIEFQFWGYFGHWAVSKVGLTKGG